MLTHIADLKSAGIFTPYKRLRLYLIKPSKYDDDGYVIRYWKGVLPSNTLACLYGLSEELRARDALGKDLDWHIETMDETVQEIDVEKIIRKSRRADTKTVVCLVGVQSNQFPRAADLALAFRAGGLSVLIGGFHVSGIMATLPELTPELEALKEAGVTLVAGEAENHWEELLRAALDERLESTYSFLFTPPDISDAPVPRMPVSLRNRYAVRRFTTLDCGRGCPYQCSFCTVINVQGRRMRFRAVDAVVNRIRENFSRYKIHHYFFTDDNFCRNKNWESIFDRLIALRRSGMHLSFMMQVDTQSYKIPGFIDKAAEAGCSQVFIGMESLNAANLEAAGKRQNETDRFKQLIDAYHAAGIITHLAYIIGFPFDSETSVRSDIERLCALGAEQASFFMLTPLPGSMDYKNMRAAKTVLDADLNNFDSFHETFRHANLDGGRWSRVYNEAWERFYSVSSMKKILKNVPLKQYWGAFLNFIWYKNAFQVEGGHPMIHGFIRLKGRRSRRSTFPLESRWVYAKRRLGDAKRTLLGWISLAFEMEEVWLATRKRSPLEELVVSELIRLKVRAAEWRYLKLSKLERVYRHAAKTLERRCRSGSILRMPIPSRFRLWFQKWNVFSDSLTFSRRPMNQFWRETVGRMKRGRIDRISFPDVAFMSFREGILFMRFTYSVLSRVVAQ